MKKTARFMIYANGTLVDDVEAPEDYTAEDYREDCSLNGWETAPCTEDSSIELVRYADHDNCSGCVLAHIPKFWQVDKIGGEENED